MMTNQNNQEAREFRRTDLASDLRNTDSQVLGPAQYLTAPAAEAVYGDPVGYLRSLGIDSELVAVGDVSSETRVLAAA